MIKAHLFRAWKILLLAYVAALTGSLVAGAVMIYGLGVSAEAVFEASTRRIAIAMPVFDAGGAAGIDSGVLIFAWNAAGALVIISFVYSASLLDPDRADCWPRMVRKLFCGRSEMRLFRLLPGCARIASEPVRRLYVWLMVPLLSVILLGVENGFSLAATGRVFGSLWTGVVTMIPHGVLEIPTFALAGAVTYSAQLAIRSVAYSEAPAAAFERLRQHRSQLAIPAIAAAVIVALMAAGFIEAHITQVLLSPSELH